MYKNILLSVVIFTTPILSQAAGFALIEQSGSGMGNAMAGGGAAAEDASVLFFNPAGMTYIKGTQLGGAVHLVKPNVEFHNMGSVAGIGAGIFASRPLGGEGGNAGDLAALPNLYFKTDFNDNIKLGVGISAPFGLKTEYDNNWLGRFQAIKSDLKTININPAIAFKVNDQLSLGFGVSAMWAQAELTNAVNLVAGEGFSKVKGDDWGFGYNLGAIYQATTDTRVSFAFRSKVDQHLQGNVKFTRPAIPLSPPALVATADSDVTASVSLPETLSLSALSKVNDTWDLMGDVTWTHWSRFKELKIVRSNGLTLGGAATPENWNNTMRYSIGANYHYNDTITLRGGLAYDEEAISDQYRTARIPGNNRKWLAFGAGWQATPETKFDVGYAHLFINDTPIDDNQISTRKGRVKGEYEGSVDILSLQLTHNF